MSSSMLTTIQNRMILYGYSILMGLGVIGNLFILIVFIRPHQNSCSIYLINAAITNLFYLTITGFSRIIFIWYNRTTLQALILCKISSYVPGFLGQVTKTMLLLACIDRYLITSDRASFRAFSTPRRAKYFILFTYIFWLIAASHILIMATTSNGQCTKLGIYAKFFAFYATFVVGLVPSIILCVLTYLTYRNIRRIRRRIQPMVRRTIQRRDRDLLVLVIAEVSVHVITTSPFSLVYLETMISQYVMPNKSIEYIQAEIFALNIALLLIFFYSAASFYTYMISSSSFRRDFKQTIMINYRQLRR